ncbi:hypothetical protein GJ496_007229 [Pomphorhynchus laevis]|nr:hypothetical protein GJ496_007229 [Pomphorhynchus laevis]
MKICEQTRLHSRLEHYDLRNSIQQAEQYLPFLSHCRVNLYDAHNKMLNRYQRATSLNDQKKNIISEAVLISEENQADMVSAEMMIHVILQEINDVYRNRQICQIETRIIIDDITMIFDVATGRKFGGEKSPEFGVLIGKMRAKYFDQLKEKTKVDDEFNRQINYYRMEQINHISKDIEKLNAQLSHESNVVERQRLIPLYIIASDANAKMKVQIAETRRLLEECLERVNRHQIDLFFQEVNNICQLSQLAEESRDVYELEMFIDLLSDAKKRIEHVLCLVKNCNDSFEYPQDMHFYGSSYKTNQTFSSIQH